MKITTKQWTALGVIVPIITALITWYITSYQIPAQETQTVSNYGINNGLIAGKIEVSTLNQRHLDKVTIDWLSERLSKDVQVQVQYSQGDSEARKYASEIRQYLSSNGWSVDFFEGWFLTGLVGLNISNRNGKNFVEVGLSDN